MKKIGKAFAAIAIAGAVAAGGSAFTASNTVVDTTAGIDETTVTGINVTSVDYDIVSNGTTGANITQVNLVQSEDPLSAVDDDLDVVVYFNDTTTPFACDAGTDGTAPDTFEYECPITVPEDLEGVDNLYITAVSND